MVSSFRELCLRLGCLKTAVDSYLFPATIAMAFSDVKAGAELDSAILSHTNMRKCCPTYDALSMHCRRVALHLTLVEDISHLLRTPDQACFSRTQSTKLAVSRLKEFGFHVHTDGSLGFYTTSTSIVHRGKPQVISQHGSVTTAANTESLRAALDDGSSSDDGSDTEDDDSRSRAYHARADVLDDDDDLFRLEESADEIEEDDGPSAAGGGASAAGAVAADGVGSATPMIVTVTEYAHENQLEYSWDSVRSAASDGLQSHRVTTLVCKFRTLLEGLIEQAASDGFGEKLSRFQQMLALVNATNEHADGALALESCVFNRLSQVPSTLPSESHGRCHRSKKPRVARE